MTYFQKLDECSRRAAPCWINLGDTYTGTGGKGNYETRNPKYRNGRNGQDIALNNKVPRDSRQMPMLQRFAIAIVDQVADTTQQDNMV